MTPDETAKHSPEDLLERLRNRIHDSPIPNEQLMDEAIEVIERLLTVKDNRKDEMDQRRSDDPREYCKFRYSAPPECCKCSDCQLVPLTRLAAWSDKIAALQSDNDRLRSLNDELQGLCVTHEICVERLQADNDRMRKALETILNFSDLEMRDGDGARAIAEETLAFFAHLEGGK